ncbi:MAG: Tat (twin-arginine translocation) pathway signal sequence containing protein [Bacteroidia bacterium]
MNKSENSRRTFITRFIAGSAALGFTSLINPLKAAENRGAITINSPLDSKDKNNADAWLEKINGKHKIMFDVLKADSIFLNFSHTFLESNNEMGVSDAEQSVVVIMRHIGIILALNDAVWSKYKLGETFDVKDEATKAPASRNMYWDPKKSDSLASDRSIQSLQKRGVMFAVCESAIDSLSGRLARLRDLEKLEVKKDFFDGVLPSIQVVPSGVWAIGRVQERGCGYCVGA